MPYPSPKDPEYCSESEQSVPNLDPGAIWHRCPGCDRLIAAKPKGTFYPHVTRKTRLNDRTRETLHAIGYGFAQRAGAALPPGPK